MIWALVDAINNPAEWAITRERDGFLRLAPVAMLPASARIIGPKGTPMHSPLVDQVYDIAGNEEFTVGQRKEQIGIALTEASATPDEPKPSLSFAVDAELGRRMVKTELPDGTIRFSLPPAHPPT
jgi:hypothetical protein